VDEDRGAVAVAVAGPEKCHRLECRHPYLEAFVEMPGGHGETCGRIAKYGASGPVFFGSDQPFGDSPPRPILVLRRPGTVGGARVRLNLSRYSAQAVPGTTGLGVPARVDVAVKDRVAHVTVTALAWALPMEEAAQSFAGSMPEPTLQMSYEMQLRGIAVALVSDQTAEVSGTAETLSCALDGVNIRLRQFSDDSEEACLRIGGTQVDLRPQQAHGSPLVLLASARPWTQVASESSSFLRWTSVRLGSSNSSLWHLKSCRMALGVSEVAVTEAVWQELGLFLGQAAPGHRGLSLEELQGVHKELPIAPPGPGQRIHLERFSVEAVYLKIWCLPAWYAESCNRAYWAWD